MEVATVVGMVGGILVLVVAILAGAAVIGIGGVTKGGVTAIGTLGGFTGAGATATGLEVEVVPALGTCALGEGFSAMGEGFALPPKRLPIKAKTRLKNPLFGAEATGAGGTICVLPLGLVKNELKKWAATKEIREGNTLGHGGNVHDFNRLVVVDQHGIVLRNQD